MADEDALPPAGEGVSVPTGLEGSEGIICVKGHTAFFFPSVYGGIVWVQVCAHVYVHACVGHRSTSGPSTLLFNRVSPWTESMQTRPGRLAGEP